ncbi:hypothetical protein VTL71DRAFT_3016 [Oculimacula yallundae]|uniref:RRM domain-containing protein n=1 Tax=Oculimacula yallundae TaxID=86028 RepID=A0ABR4C5Y3_9HELO
MNGEKKIYGMVSFEDSESAHIAQHTMNGAQLRRNKLRLVLTSTMTLSEIKSSVSTDPLGSSDIQVHKIASDYRKEKSLKDLRLNCEKLLSEKKRIASEKWEKIHHPRLERLANSLGGGNMITEVTALDRIIEDIDNNYHHESELGRNLRVWKIHFELFDKAAATVLQLREEFTDKHMFKPSSEDEPDLENKRGMLLAKLAAMAENLKKLRVLEKLFSTDLNFRFRGEQPYELRLRYTREWIIHHWGSSPDCFIDWDDGHDVCFQQVDEVLANMKKVKTLIHNLYTDGIARLKIAGLEPVFVPRLWATQESEDRHKPRAVQNSSGLRGTEPESRLTLENLSIGADLDLAHWDDENMANADLKDEVLDNTFDDNDEYPQDQEMYEERVEDEQVDTGEAQGGDILPLDMKAVAEQGDTVHADLSEDDLEEGELLE